MRTNRKLLMLVSAACLVGSPALGFAQGDRGMQHIRPFDRSGLNVFEDPKIDTTTFRRLTLAIGGGFAQEFQDLTHSTGAAPNLLNGVNTNALTPIGAGFTTAMANMYVNVQLVRGIRVSLTSYLSSRNHNETWVKDGYLLIDDSPWDVPLLKSIMKNVTLKVGHFEINYGDAHFRRTDGGNSLYNPFVGNLVMDAFTTEIGAEAYYRTGPVMLMLGATGGEIKGQTGPGDQRSPTYLTKVGYDKQLTPALRARLTASSYFTARSVKNTLFTGDRAGTHYHDVMDNTTNNWSGNLVPAFASNVAAIVVNPFIKYRSLELFGNVETAKGGASTERDRTWRQNAVDAVYRVAGERAYVAARYNTARGKFAEIANDVGVTRVQFGGGLFVTRNILGKLEYVRQTYQDFPTDDRRYGGEFKGLMLQGAVLF
ncbi:MAG: hypothetical protein ABIQ16_21005 [Polyangiaceae bacterium]